MIVTVKVHANSKVENCTEIGDGQYEVRVKAPAIEGRANEAVQKLLAKHLGVAKTRVKLVRGVKSRVKVFEADN